MEDEFDMNNVIMYQDGVLWYDKEPIYIVRAVKKGLSHWVFVYDISRKDYEKTKDDKNPIIIKRYEPKRVAKGKIYSSKSRIGSLLSEDTDTHIVNKEKPYIFQAPILTGVSSITEKECDGFYEKVVIGQPGGKSDIIPTGVFIGLTDITWNTDNYQYDVNSISEEIQRSNTQELLHRSPGSRYGFYI